MLVGTPALWWVAVPVLGYALWRSQVRRDWRYAVVLVGYLAGWLPWFANIDRQMYFFYAVVMAPFLAMAIALVLGTARGRPGGGRWVFRLPSRYSTLPSRTAWLFPIHGIPISPSTWNLQMWLPSWR